MQAGIHLLHKPVGPTSRAAMETLRPPGSSLPLCHGGALDPFAEGLLLVLVGEATRLFPYLHDIPKVYEATIAWGTETDNGDLGGRVVSTGDAAQIDAGSLAPALQRFVGWQDQVPPTTSNKRVSGERAYEKAHRGDIFTLPASRVYLHQARWLEHRLPEESRLELTVAGGYYVRALVRDLGRSQGIPAHLRRLDRRSIGPWEDPGPGELPPLRGESLLPWCPARRLSTDERSRLRRAGPIARGSMTEAEWPLPEGFPVPPVRLLYQGRLVGLARDGETPNGETLVTELLLGRGI